MRQVFILSCFLFSHLSLARSLQEEALILNQELEFLENSVKEIEFANNQDRQSQFNKALNEKSLEQTYFGEESDSVSNKASGVKRRGL